MRGTRRYSSFILAFLFIPVLLGAACSDSDSNAKITPAGPLLPPSLKLTQNAYTGLPTGTTARDTFQHMVIPAAIPDRLFTVDGFGTVQSLNLDGAGGAVTKVASFALDANLATLKLVPSTISLFGDQLAMVTSSIEFGQAGSPKVYLFDPRTARASADVVGSVVITQGETIDRGKAWIHPDGTVATTTAFEPNFANAARVAFNPASSKYRLYLLVSNRDFTAGKEWPGAVLVFDVDLAARTVNKASRSIIWTTGYNPSAIESIRDAKGKEYLLVVNRGDTEASFPYAPNTEGGVDVIDVATETIVGHIPLGMGAPNETALSPDGKRLYVASAAYAEVYELDIEDIGPELAGPPPAILYHRALHTRLFPIVVPSLSTGSQLLDIEASRDGQFLFALNYNSSELSVIDLHRAGLPVVKQTLVRNVAAGGYGNNCQFLQVRPGLRGLNYKGPQLFIGSVYLAQGQTPNNAVGAIETVEVSR